jgi:type IV pilus assembly protein PilV
LFGGIVNTRGFGLIELLITIVILAVGMLGAVTLQTNTYKQLQMSHNSGTAGMLAGGIADRMIANADLVLADAYNHTVLPEDTPTACDTTDCTAAQLAAYDVSVWQKRVTGNIASGTKTPGSLPSGSGGVSRIGTTDNFLIIVRWDDDLSGSSETNCPPQSDADLDCYQLTVSF